VAELAGKVHRDLEDAVTSARVWCASVHDGQTVGRDHVLHDKDVVELHT
jgi:ribosome-interacting GTPase 1